MDEVERGRPVALMASGMESAIGVGWTLMSSKDVARQGTGAAVSVVHRLDDGLWGATGIGL